MVRKLPFTPLPLSAWSDETQLAWREGLARQEWPKDFVPLIRRALENYFAFRQGRTADEREADCVRAYDAMLEACLSPSSAVTYLEHLMYALQTLDSGADRAWLVAFCRERRNERIPRQRQPRRQTAVRKHSLAPENWPGDLHQRLSRMRQQTQQPSVRKRYRDRAAQPAGAAATWSDAYFNRVKRGFGMYLHTAIAEGLGSLPTPDGIDRFCEITAARVAPCSMASYVWEIYQAALVLFPEYDWAWLLGDAEFCRENALPSRNKPVRIAQIAELRDLAVRLIRELELGPVRPQTACDHRNALLLLLLTYKPARRRNIVEMRYGVHIRVGEYGGSLFFPETKNGDPDGHPIPASAAQHVLVHWDRFRPVLPGAEQTDRLWMSQKGGPLSNGAVTRLIGDLTLNKLEKRIPPHLFRDCTATSIAEYGPDKLEAIPVLLGQRDPRSAATYHQRARTVEAARALERVTDEHRDGSD
jgi:integrase/recombinase XerD